MRTSKSPQVDDRQAMPPSLRGASRKLFLLVLLFSLWATVTNALPVSVTFVILTPLFGIALPKNRSMPAAAFAALMMVLYFALNTAFYAPESFLVPEFYRRDGNVFVTFLPVIIGGLVAVKVNLGTVLRGFVIWASLVNMVFLALFIVTGGTIIYQEAGVYHFLFEAHNAAGGYLAEIAAFSLGIYLTVKKGRRVFWLLLLLSNLAGLYFTVSRGSIGALVCAAILVRGLKERFLKTIVVGSAVAMIAIMSYAYPYWVTLGRPLDLSENTSTETIGSKDANVLQRVLYLWPRAVDLFIESPIFGTGYGSYNDIPYQFNGLPHLFAFNHPAELSFNSAHAHNTYLHVLAETGLVGLGLLLLMLVKMRQSINSMEPASVQLALKLAFWVAVFSSMSEHRLFTPAQMLPFTIFYGLALASSRWNRARSSSQLAIQSA
jgi:O-antigen ligase